MLHQRRHLLVVLGILLLLGMLGTSLASFLVSRSTIRDQLTSETLPLLGDTIYSEIRSDLLRPILISSLMANNTFVHDWVADGESDHGEMTRYLTEVMNQVDAFSAFFVSEKTHYYYHPKGVIKRVRETDSRDVWYFRVRDMSTPYEINSDIDLANDDETTIFVNFRVTDAAGKFLGAIGVGLTAEALNSVMERHGRAYDRVIHLADRDGNIRLSTEPLGSETTLATLLGANADGLAASLLADDGERSHRYLRDGATMFLNSRHIEELDWLLIVEKPEKSALAPITRALIANLAVSLAIAIAVLMLARTIFARYQRRLEFTAHHDALTGAFNRHYFEERLHASMERASRRGDPISLMFIDIDHFKTINDRFGHATGDSAIRHVTGQIRRALRSDDVLCRWGGEEFCVLLNNTTHAEAMAAAENVRESIENSPLTLEGQAHAITVSAGVAERWRDEGFDPLIQRADMALYLAKRDGRNRVRGTMLDEEARKAA